MSLYPAYVARRSERRLVARRLSSVPTGRLEETAQRLGDAWQACSAGEHPCSYGLPGLVHYVTIALLQRRVTILHDLSAQAVLSLVVVRICRFYPVTPRYIGL